MAEPNVCTKSEKCCWNNDQVLNSFSPTQQLTLTPKFTPAEANPFGSITLPACGPGSGDAEAVDGCGIAVVSSSAFVGHQHLAHF
jgi:hypothetical protein